MNMKYTIIGLVACLAAFCAKADFKEAKGYVSEYNNDSDSAKYSAYIVDVAGMSLTEPASISVIYSWLQTENRFRQLAGAEYAAAMSYVDYDSVSETLGFTSAVDFGGAGAQYYFIALYSRGLFGDEVYGNVLSYSSATTGGDRLDFDVGGGSFAGNSSQSGWGQVGIIPEPTSGLLVLIGLGLVALKRRELR